MDKQNDLILASHHVFDEIFILDPTKLLYRLDSRKARGVGSEDFSGIASTNENGFSACYKYQNNLWVCFGPRAYSVTDALTSSWSMQDWNPSEVQKRPISVFRATSGISSERTFELIQNHMVVERRQYTVVEPDPDTRPFVHWGEDLEDFLLWIHNMLHSRERKNLVMENWK